MAATPVGVTANKVAIVTGASRGIGRATVRRLARRGYAVVVNYAHDQRMAETAVEEVLAANGVAMAIRADVADDLDVERLFTETIETFGAFDAVVHVVRGRVTPVALTEAGVDEFDELWTTNARATFVVDRMAAREIRPGGGIVNLVNATGHTVLPAYGAYAAATVAIESLVRLLALELQHRDVNVNGVSLDTAEACQPERLADAIAYLVGPEGHATTGQILDLDDLRL